MQETYKMAGRVAAHSVLSVSGGELLVPIYGYLTADGKTKMVRVASPSAEEAMADGQKMYNDNPYQAAGGTWAVDAFITLPDVGKVDALLINICTYGEPKRELQMAIPYRHAQSSEGFAVFKPKLTALTNLEVSELQPLMDAFFSGRDEHTEAAALWQEKGQEQPTAVSGFAGFAANEWATLRDAPLAVFFMVGAADGNIDAKELKAFEKLFKESGKYPSVLMQRVMAELTPFTPQGQALLMDFLKRFTSGQFNAPQYFASINTLLSTNSEEESAVAFKNDLLAFGSAVASASGGGFLGFGSKISKEEKAVLGVIEALLSSPSELGQFMADLVRPT
ncbi:hypothetical protein [Aquipseudomonas guryensis]|uniref:Uncharacterized protein n=1 Tax=Aquipseudomonas guryensis TaxID=2759165 RepID=A0A7W4H356_9GAMM|nr:hypothetical protein [Pseudomonas guryensis]MBB1519296.1 hypothetical protein [Pseudomonas guryensis]